MDAEMRRGWGHRNVDGMGQEAWWVGAVADDAQRQRGTRPVAAAGSESRRGVCASK
jgi:hypothetical protein